MKLIKDTQLSSIDDRYSAFSERIKLFYMQEADACNAAREVAKIAYGKKG